MERQMSIWFDDYPLKAINRRTKNTMVNHLGIRFVELGDDFLRAEMPVDERTRQTYGILHGGASMALAETLGSVACSLCLDLSRKYCVGLAINGNFVRRVSEGSVFGTARALHLGRRTHLWEIRIENEAGKLVCVSRMTLAILDLADSDMPSRKIVTKD